MTLYTCVYSLLPPREGETRFSPTTDKAQAEAWVASCLAEGRQARIEVSEYTPPEPKPQYCSWCGAPICGYDMFKGPICSNDPGHWC